MESPFLHKAAFNVICDRLLQHWFLHYVQENTALFGRSRKATGWPVLLPFTTFRACLSMGLSNSRLATSFSPINGFHMSWQTWYPRTADAKANVSMFFTDGSLLCDSAQAFYDDFSKPITEECIHYALLSYLTKRNASGYNVLLFFLHENWFLEKSMFIIRQYSQVIQLHI